MAQIIVLGAGIVGVSTSIWLQRAGYHVTLVDKAGPASGTSFGNAGVLAAGGVIPVTTPGLWKKAPFMLLDKNSPLFLRWRYLPKLLPFLFNYLKKCTEEDVNTYAKGMLPLIYDAVEQHKTLANGTPAEAFIKDADYCFGYDTEKRYLDDQSSWALRKQLGFELQIQSGEEYTQTDPLYAGKFHTVVRCKQHGMVIDPGAYVKALAQHFQDSGGELVLADVIGLGKDNTGNPFLDSSLGKMSAEKLVLTAGVWSRSFMEKMGIKVPMESERGYHLELKSPERYPVNPMMVASGKFAVTPMKGRIRCAGVVEFGGTKAGPEEGPIKMLRTHVESLFDDLKYDDIEEWLGHRPAITDSLPMLGQVSPDQEIYAAFGHQHLGLTGGAKSGKILSDIITQNPTNLDLSPYRQDRFSA